MDNLRALTQNVDTAIPLNGGTASVLVENHNPLEKNIIEKTGKMTGFPFTSKRSPVGGVVPSGCLFWNGAAMNTTVNFDMFISKFTLDGNYFTRIADLIDTGAIMHFKDFVGRSVLFEVMQIDEEVDPENNAYLKLSVKGFAENLDYSYLVAEEEICMLEFLGNFKGSDYELEKIGNVLNLLKNDVVHSSVTLDTTIDIDQILENGSTNALSNNGVYQALISNKGFAISDDNFEDGINSDLTLSAGWTVGSDGIAASSSGGWANSALYNKYTTIDRVSTRALIQVITTTSIFSIIRKPVGISQYGTVAQVDLTAMSLKFYEAWDGTTTVPAVAKSITIPFSIIANRKYLVELTKDKALSVFKFTDVTNPNNTVLLSYNQETETLSGIGRQWANPGIMFNSGSIKLKRFTYATTFKNAPKLLITGHSFVEGYALIDEGDVSKTYSNLMYDSLIGNVAIAGRGGETITTINTRNDIDFFSPSYHLVDIGSNDTVYATWLSGIQTYIAKIQTAGSIPILATIVPRSGIQTFINQCNDWIRLSGYNYVDFAKAVTLNNDGITQNTALFWSDAVHPNIAGNEKMFQQIKIDAPFLWDGYSKPVSPNLDMSEVSKTASFTVALADAGKLYVINSASAVVVTYPTGLPAGKWWEFLSIGAGAVSFVAGASATLISPDTRLKLRTQYSAARIIARASNQGSLGGDIIL